MSLEPIGTRWKVCSGRILGGGHRLWMINGAHYFVLKFDKQWSLPPGERIQFSRNSKAMDRIAMGPVGVFIVQDDKTFSVIWCRVDECKRFRKLVNSNCSGSICNHGGIKKIRKNRMNWIVPPQSSLFDGSFRNNDSLWSIDSMINFRNKRNDSAL